ncbi:DUF416 family protein [Mangrovitalea sediminis]|uniref:DUF416 family protein n=1 Tax=Mangrovitalea sediminis TaxID=1982043 RepID=UPI000BE4DD19|nr:DUF416 family protein [Mangrovitalea sediminis]
MPKMTPNQERLKRQLGVMDNRRKAAFGAACCERLLPNYAAFMEQANWGSLEPIRQGLDLVWLYVDQGLADNNNIMRAVVLCEEMAPHSDDFSFLLVTAAQDACFAVCALLDFLMEFDVEKVVQAAEYATDSIDLYVQEIESMPPNSPDLEQRILNHVLMQRELSQQQLDIEFIKNASTIGQEFSKRLRQLWPLPGQGNLGLTDVVGL